jgi:hypothetical protein
MASKKNDAIVEIALSYWLDGESLNQALAKAQAQYKANNARSKSNGEKSTTAQFKSLEEKAKLSRSRIEKADIESNRKVLKEKLADVVKANNKEVAENKRKLAQIAKDETQAAKDKKKTFAGGFQNFDAKLGTISSYGAAIAIIGAVTTAVKFAITKMIEYEKSFMDLTVKAGYTRKEMALVTDTIYETANATKFSTLEIVEAATELGKLGFEANEVALILPNVANVAGATGESLKNVAEVFGIVTNAYAYNAEQAQTIGDRLIQTFNDSAMDLDKFNTAFSYVGSVAAETGTSFDELTAGMAVLSDRGVTASKIGTGLRNVFSELGREGDSLRDILQRVNDEHLSFYEIAEVVGQRAANQLLILSSSIAEFDKNVAMSSKKYGAAMEANALQMSTFSAKWDIFMNNITNKVAGSDADPLEEWRYNLRTSMDLMDAFASTNLMNPKGSEVTISNFLNANKKLFKEIRELKAKNADITEDEIRDIILKPYQNLRAAFKEGKLTMEQFEAADIERQNIQKFFQNSDGDDIGQAVTKYIEGELKSNQLTAQENYASSMLRFGDFISSKTTAKVADKLRMAIFNNDFELAKTIFSTDLITLPQEMYDKYYAQMTEFFNKRGDLTALAATNYKVSSSGKGAFQSMKDELAAIDSQIFRMKANMPTNQLDGDWKDIQALDAEVLKRKQLLEKWCALAKGQPFIKSWLRQLNVVCKEESSGRTKRGEIGKFDNNEQTETDYKVKKDLLDKQFNLADNPLEKVAINNKLIDLEKEYRDSLNEEYRIYLEKQASLRDAFIKKYPEQKTEFDLNVKNVKDAQISDEGAGKINMNTYITRDLESKVKAYEESYNKKQKYELAIAKIDEESRLNENASLKKKQAILDRKNKIVADYYDDAEKDLAKHAENLMREYLQLETINWSIISAGGTPIDLTELKEKIVELEGQLAKLNADEIKDKGHLSKKDERKKYFDYFGATMQTIDDVYALYSQIGDMKLQLIQEQVARELEVIQGRYDREAEIRNSALNAGIISQEQAFEAEQRANKKKIDQENKVNKKLFDAQKKRDTQEAIFTGLTSTAQAIANAFAKNLPAVAVVLASISAAAIAGSTAMNLKAISSRKFVPQKYADGGIVEGKSHAQGGVPFTVSGRGGYEMEGGEFVVNKQATKEHLEELIRINGKTKSNKRYLATGGIVTAESTSDDINKAILEALSKPVRAYVTDQDLAKSESERRALTRKISY